MCRCGCGYVGGGAVCTCVSAQWTNGPQNCTSTTVSHIFHLMVTSWVSRSKCSERIWGTRCLSTPVKGRERRQNWAGKSPTVRKAQQSLSQEAESLEHIWVIQVTTKGWAAGPFSTHLARLSVWGCPTKGSLKRGSSAAKADLEGAQSLRRASRLSLKEVRSGWRNSTCTKPKSYTICDPIASLTSPPASCSLTGLLAKQAPTWGIFALVFPLLALMSTWFALLASSYLSSNITSQWSVFWTLF